MLYYIHHPHGLLVTVQQLPHFQSEAMASTALCDVIQRQSYSVWQTDINALQNLLGAHLSESIQHYTRSSVSSCCQPY